MKQCHRVTRAQEELTHCNVKLRRLHTSIIDEEQYIEHRRGTNRLLLEQIELTQALLGFTGSKTPGKYKRKDLDPPSSPSLSNSPPSDSPSSKLPPSNLSPSNPLPSNPLPLESNAPSESDAPLQQHRVDGDVTSEHQAPIDDDSEIDEDDDELTESVRTMVDWVSGLAS
ncbi:hypothetical protein K435DRAFT_856226 [Dendrothele bispora CBS 962.96]|uniref:Uncharacterized protein n=1 Tax=Dendrothele bispora (strain CBS 962.96) TaxID=1314807 RepID=A0A4S8M919_DENBC|nr:hypothetical protein K435DRAFT_856226 [Dendrothele bispora CBS 962.96]